VPLAVLEALAKGVPVVVTAVGGCADQIDQSCGVLLPPPTKDEAGCVKKLAETLARLNAERDQLRAMGVAAHARARALVPPQTGVVQYVALLNELGARRYTSGLRPGTHETIEMISAGSVLDFSKPAQIWNYLGDGWSSCEETGTWTDGRSSKITLMFANRVSRLGLSFEITPLLAHGLEAQQTGVYANGKFVALWEIKQFRQAISLVIDLDKPEATIEIDLVHYRSKSPSELGASDDRRQLALFVHRLIVESAT